MSFKKYLPEFVYGSIDGTVTTFAIVSGIAGAALSPGIVLILGISNVLADGFSMASSNFLSERSKENHSIENAFKTALATFIPFVLIGSLPLASYIFNFEFYLNNFFSTNFSNFQFSILITGLTFILIGLVRGKINNTSKSQAAAETLAIGTLAALIAYYVGYALKGIAQI